MAAARPTIFSKFPDTLSASSESAKHEYRRSDTHFAIHGRKPSPGAAMELNSDDTLRPGGRIAVPTGRVFVCLAPGLRFEDHADSFRKAGYEIVETVSYASNAGWVRSAKSSIASALTGLQRLAALPVVENVEPQMLTEAVHKN
jgi:hypothetical protein